MTIIKHKMVTFEYSLKDEKGITIDSSEQSGPFTYIHGMEQTLPGMEDILDGKENGYTFDGEIPCDKAYGKKDKEFYVPVPREEFENADDLVVGTSISIMNSYEELQEMEIIAVDKENITIDANSPYADMDLKFICKVIEVRESTSEEIKEAQEEHDHECGCGCGDHE